MVEPTCKKKSAQQELIDICFELVLTATDKSYKKFFNKADQEQKAEWVRNQLKQCGFEVYSCGCSHGVLKEYK